MSFLWEDEKTKRDRSIVDRRHFGKQRKRNLRGSCVCNAIMESGIKDFAKRQARSIRSLYK